MRMRAFSRECGFEKHQQVIRKKEEVIFNAREINEKPWTWT